jgi:hypothetical protein
MLYAPLEGYLNKLSMAKLPEMGQKQRRFREHNISNFLERGKCVYYYIVYTCHISAHVYFFMCMFMPVLPDMQWH